MSMRRVQANGSLPDDSMGEDLDRPSGFRYSVPPSADHVKLVEELPLDDLLPALSQTAENVLDMLPLDMLGKETVEIAGKQVELRFFSEFDGTVSVEALYKGLVFTELEKQPSHEVARQNMIKVIEEGSAKNTFSLFKVA